MKEPYEETLDLDIYNASEDISEREGETIIYIRGDNGVYVSNIAGRTGDLANTIISFMQEDEVFADIINVAASVFKETEEVEQN